MNARAWRLAGFSLALAVGQLALGLAQPALVLPGIRGGPNCRRSRLAGRAAASSNG